MLMSLHPRGERTPKILALLLVLIAAIAFIPSIANAQKAPKKLTKQDIIDLLTGDVSSGDVAQEPGNRASPSSYRLRDE